MKYIELRSGDVQKRYDQYMGNTARNEFHDPRSWVNVGCVDEPIPENTTLVFRRPVPENKEEEWILSHQK